jgi:hypothetical protein
MLQWLEEAAASGSTSLATIGLPAPITKILPDLASRTTPLNEAGLAGSTRMARTFCTARFENWLTCLSTLA